MFQPVRQVSVNFADNEKQSNKTFNILYFMKTNLVNLALGLAFTGGAVSCQSQKNDLVFPLTICCFRFRRAARKDW